MSKHHKREAPPPLYLARLTCMGCGVNALEIGEYYMLNPRIWEDQLGLYWQDNLCIGCLEKRLGRKVSLSDMCGIPRYEFMFPLSERLLDRYGVKAGKVAA
jgi:hypothetical protein